MSRIGAYRLKKLPKGLKEWSAYCSLETTISENTGICYLLYQMADAAMKSRHWNIIGDLIHHQFDHNIEHMLFKDILACPLTAFKDDIEV